MKKIKNILVITLSLISMTVLAQPSNPPDGPIHGIIYLLLAGIGMGIFGLKNKKDKNPL